MNNTNKIILSVGFMWSQIDISNNFEWEELHEFLNKNYVEDSCALFRFNYSSEFLHWALMPPNQFINWLVGIRTVNDNKLVGFISAIPAKISIYGKHILCAEINFLCVHKKLRLKKCLLF